MNRWTLTFLFLFVIAGPRCMADTASLSAQQLYDRTQSILQALSIPAEAAPSDWLHPHVSIGSGSGKILSWLDPQKQWSRFANQSASSLTVYQDRDLFQVADFQIDLNASFRSLPRPKQIMLGQAGSQPLAGLKIALDPGHMGTEYWDHETGKFIHDSNGQVISEGVHNLIVCLLLAQDLRALGAEVLVTRDGFVPVSTLPPEQLNLKNFAQHELLDNTLSPWFVDLAASGTVFNADQLMQNENIHRLFSEDLRMEYFIEREDLNARADKINAFQPDLTLIIHSDASDNADHPEDPNLLSDMPDVTRAYVIGAFADTDFAMRENRAAFMAHFLDQDGIQKSLNLAKSIEKQISEQLKIPYLRSAEPNTVAMAPGVFARNLLVSRKIHQGVVVYLECLVYDNNNEFYQLLSPDGTLTIRGQSVPYSNRALALAHAIRDGIVNDQISQSRPH